MNRTEHAKKNMIWGSICYIIEFILPFLIRTIFLMKFSSDYLGLSSLISSIIQMLNISELGFRTAVVYSMYKPVADNNLELIGSILDYYRKIYRIIALVIMGIGIFILPFIRFFIKGDIPDVNIYIIYIIYLINSISSYSFGAYKSAIVIAYQRNDIISKSSIISRTILSVLQLLAILVFDNFYFYCLSLMCGTIINNLYIARISSQLFIYKKKYSELQNSTRQQIVEKVKGLMIGKLTAISRNGFDSIFISMFVGLAITAKYSNYYLILSSINAFLSVLCSSIIAGVGNSIAKESKEKNHKDMIKFDFIYMWFTMLCTTLLLCEYQVFTKTFWGHDMLFPNTTMVLFPIYFYIMQSGNIRYIYAEACGLWWENRYRAIVEMLANIILNYILGKLFGVAGILMATIISLLFIGFMWGSNIVYKYYFVDEDACYYYFLHLRYLVATIFISLLDAIICKMIPYTGVFSLLINACICIIISNILYYAIFSRTIEFGEAKSWIKEIFFKSK